MSTVGLPFFPSVDIYRSVLHFVEVNDIFNVDLVCVAWQKALSASHYWEYLYEKEKIPLVEGENRNLRADLKKIYPITLSGAKIEKYLGKIVGKIPRLRLVEFKKLFTPDRYSGNAKKMGETYEVIVLPDILIRTFRNGQTAKIDEKGRLIICNNSGNSAQEATVEIPFSFPNLATLSQHPLVGGCNGPVFSVIANDVFNQCTTVVSSVKLYLMRRTFAVPTLNLFYEKQEADAREKGLQISPLIVRGLSNTIKVLESGLCPDNQWTSVRTSDRVLWNNHSYQVEIGGYAISEGMDVDCIITRLRGRVGVIPCTCAELTEKNVTMGNST